MHRLLSGIRVLDLSHILAGPFGSQLLGDLGAYVIKIEQGKGDPNRGLPPFIAGESAQFFAANRSKRGIILNLKSKRGLEIFYELVKVSDIVWDNFRAGVSERLKVNYERLSQINPRIICCSITGFGDSGPYATRPAYDLIAQALGGMLSISGEPGRPPVKAPVALTDIAAGILGVVGVLAALENRHKTNRGTKVSTSLLEAQVCLLATLAQGYFFENIVPEPVGSGHPHLVPYNVFKTKDSYIVFAPYPDSMWPDVCEALDVKHLKTDPKFVTNVERLKNKELVLQTLGEVFLKKTSQEWMDICSKYGIACAPVNTMDKVFEDPQVLHQEMVLYVDHPKCGKVKTVGVPIKFRAEVPDKEFLPPPLLGQHTDEILRELLNLSKEELIALHKEGVL